MIFPRLTPPAEIQLTQHRAGVFVRLPVALATSIPNLLRTLQGYGFTATTDTELSGQLFLYVRVGWPEPDLAPFCRQVLVNTLAVFYPNRVQVNRDLERTL